MNYDKPQHCRPLKLAIQLMLLALLFTACQGDPSVPDERALTKKNWRNLARCSSKHC